MQIPNRTSLIKTIPSGAKVYENGALKGFTPHMHWDRESGKASKIFTLQKEGYKEKVITIKKTDFNPLRLIGPPILALPWVYDYPTEYIYELEKSEQRFNVLFKPMYKTLNARRTQ